jgi:oxygen-independent coproporphyrinogen III oxidase
LNEIKKEVIEFKEKYEIDDIETIYIGGGNPSIDIENIKEINEIIKYHFNLNSIKEYTIECNPLNINQSNVNIFKEIGITRVSMGVQTFTEKAIIETNRKQKNIDIYKAFDLLNKNFSLSFDLINGLPYSNIDIELKNIENLLIKYDSIKHISFYELSIDNDSKYYSSYKNVFMNEKEKELYNNQFKILMNMFNFNQYEISNYSLQNHESIHNKAYWKYKNYIGIGPGAHSTINNIRIENEKDVNLYINSGNYKKIYNLTKIEQIEEYLLMGLRLIEGIDINDFNDRFNIDLLGSLKNSILKYDKKILIIDDKLMISVKGLDILNKILIDFFEEIEEKC